MRVIVPVYQTSFRILNEVTPIREAFINGAFLKGKLHIFHATGEVGIKISR